MVGGSILVGICLMMLGWTAEIVGLFVSGEETVCVPVSAVTAPPLTIAIEEVSDDSPCSIEHLCGGFCHQCWCVADGP